MASQGQPGRPSGTSSPSHTPCWQQADRQFSTEFSNSTVFCLVSNHQSHAAAAAVAVAAALARPCQSAGISVCKGGGGGGKSPATAVASSHSSHSDSRLVGILQAYYDTVVRLLACGCQHLPLRLSEAPWLQIATSTGVTELIQGCGPCRRRPRLSRRHWILPGTCSPGPRGSRGPAWRSGHLPAARLRLPGPPLRPAGPGPGPESTGLSPQPA